MFDYQQFSYITFSEVLTIISILAVLYCLFHKPNYWAYLFILPLVKTAYIQTLVLTTIFVIVYQLGALLIRLGRERSLVVVVIISLLGIRFLENTQLLSAIELLNEGDFFLRKLSFVLIAGSALSGFISKQKSIESPIEIKSILLTIAMAVFKIGIASYLFQKIALGLNTSYPLNFIQAWLCLLANLFWILFQLSGIRDIILLIYFKGFTSKIKGDFLFGESLAASIQKAFLGLENGLKGNWAQNSKVKALLVEFISVGLISIAIQSNIKIAIIVWPLLWLIRKTLGYSKTFVLLLAYLFVCPDLMNFKMVASSAINIKNVFDYYNECFIFWAIGLNNITIVVMFLFMAFYKYFDFKFQSLQGKVALFVLCLLIIANLYFVRSPYLLIHEIL